MSSLCKTGFFIVETHLLQCSYYNWNVTLKLDDLQKPIRWILPINCFLKIGAYSVIFAGSNCCNKWWVVLLKRLSLGTGYFYCLWQREKGVCGCLSDNSVLKILKIIIRIYLKRLLLKSSKFYVEVALVLPRW